MTSKSTPYIKCSIKRHIPEYKGRGVKRGLWKRVKGMAEWSDAHLPSPVESRVPHSKKKQSSDIQCSFAHSLAHQWYCFINKGNKRGIFIRNISEWSSYDMFRFDPEIPCYQTLHWCRGCLTKKVDNFETTKVMTYHRLYSLIQILHVYIKCRFVFVLHSDILNVRECRIQVLDWWILWVANEECDFFIPRTLSPVREAR